MEGWSGTDEARAAHAMEKGAYSEAFRLLQPLVERDSAYAFASLGWLYETGAIGVPDENAARVFYQRAAALGSSYACLNLGWLLAGQGQDSLAQAAFQRGAELGDDQCRSALQRLIANRDERRADEAINEQRFEEAATLLRPLAEQNSEYALLTLGWLEEIGSLGTPDKLAARALYERAANRGSAEACLSLGHLLLDQHEKRRARDAFQNGAKRGDLACMAELGKMMTDGSVGSANLREGLGWLQKASAGGHFFARRTLLAIEERNARSVLRRISIKLRIVLLALTAGREAMRDPRSERLR